MAQDTTPAMVIYTGTGTQTRFEVPFDKGSFGEIKVAFVRRGLTDYEYDPDTYDVQGYLYAWNGGVYTKTEEATTDTPLYDKTGAETGDTWTEGMYREPKNDIFTQAVVEWSGDPITTEDIICIVRDTTTNQPYTYPNNQKHIERALDNLSRQIQEVAKKAENALLVDPAWMGIDRGGIEDPKKMDPVAWLQTIVRSKGLTLRELRVEDGYIAYTADDPDSETKTWEVIAGVKTGNAGVVSHVREYRYTDSFGHDHLVLQYSTDGGESWKSVGGEGNEASWGSIIGNIDDQTDLTDKFVAKAGDVMSGPLSFSNTSGAGGIYGYTNGVIFFRTGASGRVQLAALSNEVFMPYETDTVSLGGAGHRWKELNAGAAYLGRLVTPRINNGYDIAVPVTSSADTFALRSEVSAAANTGTMLTDKGVWYAKMESATTPPAEAEVEGRDYADFSQVDGQGNPIIVIYEYTSGAWTVTDTITPPSAYDGYVLVTSKIWDIPEQIGQQGGRVVWNHTNNTFTPFPTIISYDGASITNGSFQGSADLSGTSTVVMPSDAGNTQIVNKGYVDAMATSGAFDLFDIKWRDATLTRAGWELSDGTWKTNASAYQHLVDDITNDSPTLTTETVAGVTVSYYRAADGHKICLPEEETNVDAIYAATGVAWYYILDTDNQQFKLPRTQFGFTGTRTTVGDYVAAGLPNITGEIGRDNNSTGFAKNSNLKGCFKLGASQSNCATSSSTNGYRIGFDASRSNAIYGASTTVQSPATQMLLYFFVGA